MNDFPELNVREKEVLQYIIQNFIITANPVPSKGLIAGLNWNLSSATIRNVMNSLEKKGLLDHLHTSSGRIPTHLGYRFYVDSLMKTSRLNKKEQDAIQAWGDTVNKGLNDAIQSASFLLSRLANLLAIIIAPSYSNSIFRKMELIDLEFGKLLIVLTIESGLVKTITVEVSNPISDQDLRYVSSILNERFNGLRLKEISESITVMLSDYQSVDKTGLIRIFIDSASDLFQDSTVRKFYFGGVEYMALQPEFSNLNQYKSIVEFVENEDLIIHLFEEELNKSKRFSNRADIKSDVNVRIGSELNVSQIESCSVVSATYSLGQSNGTVGLVGPARMNYPKMVALVEQMATRLNQRN